MNAVELRSVSRRFPGMDRPALDRVDLTVAPGEMVDVLGPSGSGKSTLVALVNGLERPDSGRVWMAGRDVTELSADRRPTATVFQQDNLFPDLDVAANVSYPLRVAGHSPRHVADQTEVMLLRVGLAGMGAARPDDLSGGQRRRVALARALVGRPEVLLLDEPLAGLEPGLRAGLLDLLERLRHRLGTTVVHVTHHLTEALATADRLALLRAGRLVAVDTPRRLHQQPPDSFVASFLGRSSHLDATVVRDEGDRRLVDVLGTPMSIRAAAGVPRRPGQVVTVLVRPCVLHVERLAGTGPARRPTIPHGATGIVQQARFRGETMEYVVETSRGSLVGTGDLWDEPLSRHDPVRLTFDTEHLWLLP